MNDTTYVLQVIHVSTARVIGYVIEHRHGHIVGPFDDDDVTTVAGTLAAVDKMREVSKLYRTHVVLPVRLDAAKKNPDAPLGARKRTHT